MSINVRRHIKQRINNVKFLQLPSSLIFKIQKWLIASKDELSYITIHLKMASQGPEYYIVDYLGKSFLLELQGEFFNNIFYPSDYCLKVLQSIESFLINKIRSIDPKTISLTDLFNYSHTRKQYSLNTIVTLPRRIYGHGRVKFNFNKLIPGRFSLENYSYIYDICLNFLE